jgi:hypothetical protein
MYMMNDYVIDASMLDAIPLLAQTRDIPETRPCAYLETLHA